MKRFGKSVLMGTIAVAGLGLVLTGCGKSDSTQKQFVAANARMGAFDNQKSTLSITGTGKQVPDVIATQSLKLVSTRSKHSNLVETKISNTAKNETKSRLGYLVDEKHHTYYSEAGDYIASLMTEPGAFNFKKADVQLLNDKFVSGKPSEMLTAPAQTARRLSATLGDPNFQTALSQQMAKVLKGKFKKDGNTISYQFSKTEVAKLLDKTNAALKNKGGSALSSSELKPFKTWAQRATITETVNLKQRHMVHYTVKYRDSRYTLKLTTAKSNTKLTLPTNKQIMTSAAFQKKFSKMVDEEVVDD